MSIAVVHVEPTPGQLAAIDAMKQRILMLALPGIMATLRDTSAA